MYRSVAFKFIQIILTTCLLNLTIGAHADDAATATVALTQDETQSVTGMFNRLGVKGAPVHGVCYSSSARVETVTKSMSAAHWTITYNDGMVSELTQKEVRAMLEIFNRAHVEGSTQGVTYRAAATISEYSCEMSPSSWTISFAAQK